MFTIEPDNSHKKYVNNLCELAEHITYSFMIPKIRRQ